MKISKVRVTNYHSLKDVEIGFDNYSIFIGPNGTGKSSVLWALNWFFNGGLLSISDIHDFQNEDGTPRYSPEDIQANPSLDTVRVMVTFCSLTDRDHALLRSYGRGQTAVFTKIWRLGLKEKYVGKALQGPGFTDIRSFSKLTDSRPAYRNLRLSLPELPDLGVSPQKEEMLSALQAWEDDPKNIDRLVQVDEDDATHMFGFNGPNVIKECVSFVLVPASCDMTSDIATNKKGSTLNNLIGSLMSSASDIAKQAWIQQNKDVIDRLTETMRDSIARSTTLQSERVNEKLTRLIPSASIEFNTHIPEWIPNPSPDISTVVNIDGSQRGIDKQGDGIQRAVMIAMFESLIPDRTYYEKTFKPGDGQSEEEATRELNEVLEKLPAIVICIEEPEIYQHPVRARSFGKVLLDMSFQSNVQVVIATHSPYFVLPSQFSSIRRFSLECGISKTKQATISDISRISSTAEEEIQKTVERYLPTSFSEGFFSDKVVLVEGNTDKAIVEAIAEKLGSPFECKGISVLDMSGKNNLHIPHIILEALNTPTYIIVDGDSAGAARKHPQDQQKQQECDLSKKASTEKVLNWLPIVTNAVCGNIPYAYRDPSVVTEKYSIWIDDIEGELSLWPSFCQALLCNGGALRDEKNLRRYRQAVLDASLHDIPTTLYNCVQTILGM